MNQETNAMLNSDYRRFVVMKKSNHSYTINHKITEVFNSNSFKNCPCYIVGGGETVQQYDLSKLDNELTIGINKAFQFYPKVKINYSMDSDFYEAMKSGRYNDPNPSHEPIWDAWMKYEGKRIFLAPMERKKYGEEVYLVRRQHAPKISRDLEEGIYGGQNSGVGALLLAIALGANPIYLLGYDMQVDIKTHWHNGYPNRNIEDFREKLIGYRTEIEKLAPTIKEQGIAVLNLNPNSGLRCFPFADASELMKG